MPPVVAFAATSSMYDSTAHPGMSSQHQLDAVQWCAQPSSGVMGTSCIVGGNSFYRVCAAVHNAVQNNTLCPDSCNPIQPLCCWDCCCCYGVSVGLAMSCSAVSSCTHAVLLCCAAPPMLLLSFYPLLLCYTSLYAHV